MSQFPTRWPVHHPERLQLYSLATPNGQKIGIMLEETGLEYEAHRVDIMSGEQFDPEYLRINPNGKIPTVVDPHGPGGAPLAIMESGAILIYLAEKAGMFLPTEPRKRSETLEWLFFQMASIGPFFGQFGHFFKFAKDKTADDYALDRYSKEAKRLLGVLDVRLAEQPYLAGDEYTVADIATVPWLKALDFYGGKSALDYDSFSHIEPWVQRCAERPAYQRGARVNGF